MTPIFSADAEKAVLGSLIINPDKVADLVFSTLKHTDFFVPDHQKVLLVLTDLYLRCEPFDIVAINHALQRAYTNEQRDYCPLLTDLVTIFASPLNVTSYIKIIKDNATLRKIQAFTEELPTIIQEQQQSQPVIEKLIQFSFSLTENIAAKQETKLADTVKELQSEFAAAAATTSTTLQPITDAQTGIQQLDQALGGLRPQCLYILAARPGTGKTALALQTACYTAAKRYCEQAQDFVTPGNAVGIFSIEMSKRDIAQRIISNIASVNLKHVQSGRLQDFEQQCVTAANNILHSLPIYIDDSSDITITQLRAKARKMLSLYNIKLLIVDYLQLIRGDQESRKQGREREVAEISRILKVVAKELNIPILCLAQLNRQAAESDREPALHNLRESGSIEQDADAVLFLHRTEQHTKLIIAKNRHGTLDATPLSFAGGFQRFIPIANQ